MDSTEAKKLHNTIFGNSDKPIRVFMAPARVNIIGEHVDYLGGLVLPAAINFYIVVSIRATEHDGFSLYSAQYKQRIDTSEIRHFPDSPWADYVLGVIDELKKDGKDVKNFEMVIDGNIPQGAGLSSSASLEVATGYALNEVFNLNLSRKEIAVIGKLAENNFNGTNCGIMDQYIISCAKPNSCLLLNTETLESEVFTFDMGTSSFFLINSCVKHSLKDSAYNKRIQECESALQKLRKAFPDLKNLYNAVESMDENISMTIEERKRFTHVVSEKKRTTEMIAALQKGDMEKAGTLLTETHYSLSKDYEVSCEETDFIVENCVESGALGARMIGGGFGGCVLVLSDKSKSNQIQSTIKQSFQKHFAKTPEIYEFSITEGVREV